jgi:hypothetical protein
MLMTGAACWIKALCQKEEPEAKYGVIMVGAGK